jgi:hypothetical protein
LTHPTHPNDSPSCRQVFHWHQLTFHIAKAGNAWHSLLHPLKAGSSHSCCVTECSPLILSRSERLWRSFFPSLHANRFLLPLRTCNRKVGTAPFRPPSIPKDHTPATVDEISAQSTSSTATFGSRRLRTILSPQVVAVRPVAEIRSSGAPMPYPAFSAHLGRISAVQAPPTPIIGRLSFERRKFLAVLLVRKGFLCF